MAEIIFGIDHGNGNMKGENVCFPCGLVRYVSEPGRFMNEDILEYQGTYYTLSDTKMPFKADKTVDDDYFILTLYALAMEARNKGITLTGKDVVLGVGLPPADYGQQATSFKKYFLDHAKHGISFKMNGKSVNFYLKDVFVSPQNFAAVMCFKASLLKKYRTVNCIDIGDGTVDLLVIRNGKPDLSVRVSDRSGMAVLRSEISNAIQQNYGIHLDSSDVEQVLMQEETILDEKIILEIQRMAENWLQRIINKLHTHVTDFRTNPAVFLGGGSLLLRKQIENSPEFKYVEFIDDVRANAIGYEKLTTARLRRGLEVLVMGQIKVVLIFNEDDERQREAGEYLKTKKRCKTALVTELVQAWMKNGETGTGTYTGAVSIDAIKKQLLQDKEFLLEIEKSMGGTSCREVEETEPEDSDNLDMDEDMMLAGMSIFENEI